MFVNPPPQRWWRNGWQPEPFFLIRRRQKANISHEVIVCICLKLSPGNTRQPQPGTQPARRPGRQSHKRGDTRYTIKEFRLPGM